MFSERIYNPSQKPTSTEPEQKLSDAMLAEKLGISERKLISMREYAKRLRIENPRMDERRIMSKVAKKYNIKLV